jgi:hypothetical protein
MCVGTKEREKEETLTITRNPWSDNSQETLKICTKTAKNGVQKMRRKHSIVLYLLRPYIILVIEILTKEEKEEILSLYREG